MIKDDYNELSKVFPNNTKHYVGIMPSDPRRKIIYGNLTEQEKENTNIILLGNSATKENNHIEVLKMLEHLKDDNIKIKCPLSYGDMNYAKEVIEIGKKLFDDKFEPITEYMEYNEYINLLSTIQVAIFNNDRQQAMGNINTLLRMGKKIYLREGTSMWKNYNDYNIVIYDVSEIERISTDELFRSDIENQRKNIEIMKKRYIDNNGYDCWKTILDS